MNKLLHSITAIFVGTLLSASALADATYNENQMTYSKAGKFMMGECYASINGELNFCDGDIHNEMTRLFTATKPNFGKNSVLMRFWDKDINQWFYVAVNNTTKRVYFAPNGVRTYKGNNLKAVQMRFSNSELCSTGDNTQFETTVPDGKSFFDNDLDLDFCTSYDDNNGFGITKKTKAKTGKTM